MKIISSVLVLLLAVAASAFRGEDTTPDPQRWCRLNLGPAWGGNVCH